jgi:methyltransferase family protein
MKVTDYAPRAAPFDTYLKGRDLFGAEIGVDVGAHAEALLRYCGVRLLVLIDPWPREYYRGFCTARLQVLGFWSRVSILQQTSQKAAPNFDIASLDFLYFDQEHTFEAVRMDLEDWWPRLKPGGLLGYRNYGPSAPDLTRAVDAFVARHHIKAQKETGEILLWK